MATTNWEGAVTAGCTRCRGALSTFEWRSKDGAFGFVREVFESNRGYSKMRREFRLFRCAGCGRGGLGIIVLPNDDQYPSKSAELEAFTPDVLPSVKLPDGAPKDIVAEFREGEACLQNGCSRAAAAIFRSALEKTLAASGHKVDRHTSLYAQIETAAADGTITETQGAR